MKSIALSTSDFMALRVYFDFQLVSRKHLEEFLRELCEALQRNGVERKNLPGLALIPVNALEFVSQANWLRKELKAHPIALSLHVIAWTSRDVEEILEEDEWE